MNCPFCNQDDFDKVGLKYHLENYCEAYRAVPDAHNPCWGCEYRKMGEPDWSNVCLLDECNECVRNL